MPLTTIEPAQSDPVALEDAKAWCRVSENDEDDLIADLIAAATDEVQRLTGRQFVPARFRLTLREFPACLIRLPRSPLLAVGDVQYRDTNGDLQPLTNEVDYFVDDAAEPATVEPVVRWPATYDAPDAVQITFRAGYEATESPTEPAPPPPRALVAIKSLAA